MSAEPSSALLTLSRPPDSRAGPRAPAVAWNVIWILAALAGLIAFYMIGAAGMPLIEPDEPRSALIARHMLATGDYLAPHLLGEPYFDKPPLFFWMLAGSVRLFGENEWALRLPPALISAATVVLTALLAGQFFGRRAAWWTGATFAVAVIVVIGARVLRMDMFLATWVTAALLCWSRQQQGSGVRGQGSGNSNDVAGKRQTRRQGEEETRSNGRTEDWGLRTEGRQQQGSGLGVQGSGNSNREEEPAIVPASLRPRVSASSSSSLQTANCQLPTVVLMYLCLALGCLTKGPVAVVLPAMVIGLYMLLSQPLRTIPRAILALRPFLGLAIITILYGSWVAYMTWRFPQYPAEFFGRQNLERFAGNGLNAANPWWYIPGTFLGGLMPWLPLTIAAGWARRPRRDMEPADKLLWIWALSILAFFTISKGRMPNYVLPALPPAFVLLGGFLANVDRRWRMHLAIGLIATLALFAAGIIGLAIFEATRPGLALNHRQLAINLGAVAALAAVSWWLWRRAPWMSLLPLLLASALGMAALAYGPARAYCASRSSKVLAEPLAAIDPAAGPVAMATSLRLGAVYYAPPGWQFRTYSHSQLRDLLPLLETSRPLYAILTGGGILQRLQEDAIVGIHVSNRLTILAQIDRDALVRIDPAPASQPAAKP